MSSRVRESEDRWGKYWEEETGRGWRKLRREIEGIQFQLYGAQTIDYMMAIKAADFDLRLNDMNDKIESNGKEMTDITEAMILNQLLDYGMTNTGRIRLAIAEAAARQRYHPVKEYLEKLPKWDGRDHFSAFMARLSMSSPLAEVFWRKWFIGSIAKALAAKQNFMLVLLGKQNGGKSYLVRWLCPDERLFYEGPINPDDKDCKLRALNHWIWEVGELDATTRRSDVAALKFFITEKVVSIRPPYGRHDIKKPAAASFIGTINPDGTAFLNDNENRRFGLVYLDSIDWDYTKSVDKQQLWAQMYAAYLAGEAHELTSHEREIQQEINLDHVTESPLEALLMEYFELDASRTEETMSVIELLEKLETLGLRGDQFKNKMELGKVMARHGINKRRITAGGQRQFVYEGIFYKDKNRVISI
jgi:predicted P-loop ATPase